MKVDNVYKIARAPVLILGESGTGKSVFAKKIHNISPLSGGNFQVAHLGSISENLIERELFGHVRGAFTGAINSGHGHLDKAQGGTLFLDEIGDLNLEVQKKLLMILEEKKYAPLGSTIYKTFNGRIIAATNKCLSKMVQKGDFREDLYYRLLTFIIRIPSLREDNLRIRDLLDHYISKYIEITNHVEFKLDFHAKKLLQNYSWPGNIRELKSCVENIVYSFNCNVSVFNLPNWIIANNKHKNSKDFKDIIGKKKISYREMIEKYDKKLIFYFLEKNQGKINQTSRDLDINKTTLIAKIRKYSINTLEIKSKFY